jgi:hypothetical protein
MNTSYNYSFSKIVLCFDLKTIKSSSIWAVPCALEVCLILVKSLKLKLFMSKVPDLEGKP